ncbi:uncharacterized protein N7459_005484 [Penicillium hispanicum]|uniref:uncharacterized protein n=1 Tax=Penicillium hispanicum TaxID=1080232 RepID=UPI002540C423|nr:uncharacterized protein N7459_005484 [Penicillium hispanicum]KAJ5579499.1 hypothetical protein N7459_005484 [Penicillium hispanicum]
MDITDEMREPLLVTPRRYQLEMLEASQQQNIIVAMDTGSGKTHIAVLRIIAELERNTPDKLVWFLAPTVALCLQQHEVIASQIPLVKTRILTGLDNVDRWTDQSIWNSVLRDVRVVVSTHAVLADALNHGFVRISQLALMIFDEGRGLFSFAHHCMRRHPANRIMQNHYHPTRLKFGPHAVPRILGLTASPITRTSRQELQTIEANLDAVCRTPRIHRTELLEHVHRPHLERITYAPCPIQQQGTGSRLLQPLIQCIQAYDVQNDPYIEAHRLRPDTQVNVEKMSFSGKTFCSDQLAKLVERSNHIYEELGGWATDYFIEASVDQLRHSIENDTSMSGLDRAERVYLLEILLAMPVLENCAESWNISPKLETLLAFLSKMDRPGFSGLIFAKRRATVSVLARMLSMHPATKESFRCAAYVGWSSNSGRKDSLGDLLSQDMQRDTLSEFRAGRKNLIVATDVLEEGLDVSSCSLVICYDKPPNLKSFVQRRGRARHQESTYAIMISTEDDSLDLIKWQGLEQAMIEAYQDDERRRRKAWEVETIEETVGEFLSVPSTGACLVADDALQHLHHFCSVLPLDDYVSNRPVFTFKEDLAGLVKSTVTLPNSVHPAVRRTQGKTWWRTERAATRETAFLAYKALFEFGLVNDNLLPLTKKPELRFSEDVELPSLMNCSEQYDPYVDLAQAWSSPNLYQTEIILSNNGRVKQDLLMSIVLPKMTVMPEPIPLYWESEPTLIASLKSTKPLADVTMDSIQTMRHITAIYLQAPSSRVRGPDRDFICLFVPSIPHVDLQEWAQTYEGTEKALDVYTRDASTPPVGIIRDTARYGQPRLFRQWIASGEGANVHIEIECQSLPRRRNFLQATALPVGEDGELGPPKIHVIPALGCTLDRLPATQAVFGLLISSILDRLEATLVASKLNETILKGVGIQNLSHVLTAITTPLAQATTHYQLYEFFGDSVLKFTVGCQLFFTKPAWHEGYLSESRDKLIQNKRLARAALDTGLDEFILTNRFTPRRWNAPVISQKLAQRPRKRRLSMKVLADVVEALIGAAYMDGGIYKAQACLHRFLPEIDIFTSNLGHLIVPTPRGVSNLVDEFRVANLIGYTFDDASLLTEALTHPSCEHDIATQSYQRLEYLGDAVLDMVVVSVLAAHPAQLSQGKMTLIKHAVVNANLMAFLCMKLSVGEETAKVVQTENGDPDLVPHFDEIHLWRFLRFNGPAIPAARDACLEKYRALGEEITAALEHAPRYPWELLARLHADKFLSDIVESTLGAMFIDSRGNLDACSAFLERLGLLPYLRRILSDAVDVQHPRNTAQDLLKTVGCLVFKPERIEKKGHNATYRCPAVVNKQEIALIEGCGSAEEAEVRVAHLVIDKVRAEANGSD